MNLWLRIPVLRTIAALADLHAGSPYAPWPRGFETKDGRRIPPSDGQEILNGYLEDFGRECDRRRVDTVLTVGDLVQGLNVKAYGADLMVSDLDEQARAAEALLRPLVRGRGRSRDRRLAGVLGTEYHDGIYLKAERIALERLGGRCLGLLANVPIAGTRYTVNIAHGVSQAFIYQAAKLERELLAYLEAHAQGKAGRIDLFLRAHSHHWISLDSRKIRAVQLPAWQDWTPWKGGVHTWGKRLPDLGAAILLLTEREILVEHYPYPSPQIATGPVAFLPGPEPAKNRTAARRRKPRK